MMVSEIMNSDRLSKSIKIVLIVLVCSTMASCDNGEKDKKSPEILEQPDIDSSLKVPYLEVEIDSARPLMNEGYGSQNGGTTFFPRMYNKDL